MIRWKLAAGWVALQVLFFCGWAAYEEGFMAPGEGTSILVKTAPVDPRDLLRGQYMQLAYEFSGTHGSDVWVILRKEGEFHVPQTTLHYKLTHLEPGQVTFRGRLVSSRLIFGIEEYYVPEGTPTPNARDLTVRLRVGRDGNVRIEKVYLRGVPWP